MFSLRVREWHGLDLPQHSDGTELTDSDSPCLTLSEQQMGSGMRERLGEQEEGKEGGLGLVCDIQM